MSKSKSKIKELPKEETNTSSSKKKIVIIFIVLALVITAAYLLLPDNQNSISKSDSKSEAGTSYEFVKDGELTFISSDDSFLSQIDIEIAANEEERTRGLMYRDKMDENEGMFFIFDRETQQSFWMKNTLIPLDIIFVNKNNKIVKIHRNTHTLSEESYPSGAPAIYVVEVNAGYCDKFGITEKDKIVWRRM